MGCCVAEEYLWCDEVDIFVTHQGKEYCIFHAPAECEEKKRVWVNNYVFKRINSATANLMSCDLSGTIFPTKISFKRSMIDKLSYIDFSQTTFIGKASFRNVTLGAVNFRNAIFNNTADFSCTTLKGNTDFGGARFSGDAIFQEGIFNEDGIFYQTIFAGVTIFRNSSFNKSAVFSKATFNEDTSFSLVTFSLDADFDNAIFKSDANFYSTNFAGSTLFNSVFFTAASFNASKFEKTAYFSDTRFAGGDFQNCHVGDRLEFDRADLRGLSLLGAPIESFRFISCRWPKNYTRNITFDARRVNKQGYFDIHNMDEVKPWSEEEKAPEHILLEDLFRRLKKRAKSEEDEMMASDWHYNEKEMQLLRFAEPDKGLLWTGRISNFLLFQILTAYKMFSGYGEAPLRALLCLLIFTLLPLIAEVPHSPEFFQGGMLNYLPLVKEPPPNEISIFGRLWMITWQLIITIQAALFGFALRNKFRR